MERMYNIHRSIVRATTTADGWELRGEFNRVEGEEYGSYIYVEPHNFDPQDSNSLVLVCSLDEDFGDIEIGPLAEFLDQGYPEREEIRQALNKGEREMIKITNTFHDGELYADIEGQKFKVKL